MSELSGWAASHRSEHLKVWAKVWREDRKSQLPRALPRFSPFPSPTCLSEPGTAHFKSISDSPARCTSSENHKLVYWIQFRPRDELSLTDSRYRAILARVCAWSHFITWCHNHIPEGKACVHRPPPAQPNHTAVCNANTLCPQVAMVTIITTSYPPSEYWNSPHLRASSSNNKHGKGGQIWKVGGGIQ